MTLVLDLPEDIEAQVRRAAELKGEDLAVFVINAAREKAAIATEHEFDERHFDSLVDSDPMAAFDYLLEHTPNPRQAAGLGPLPDDAIEQAYLDAVLGEAEEV